MAKEQKPVMVAQTEEWVPWIWARHGSDGNRVFVEIEGHHMERKRIYGDSTLTITFQITDPKTELLAYRPDA